MTEDKKQKKIDEQWVALLKKINYKIPKDSYDQRYPPKTLDNIFKIVVPEARRELGKDHLRLIFDCAVDDIMNDIPPVDALISALSKALEVE